MAVHYILPDDDDGSPLDAEILAIYAKLKTHAEASLKPPQIDPVERATEAMTEIAAELLLRAQSWALLHFRCAVARGLPSGSAAFVEAADTFAELIDEARAYGLSEGISQAARDAYWAAFAVTERESHHKLPDEFRRLCREAKLRELGIEEEELTGDLGWKLGHLCREAMFAELCKQPGFAQFHEAEASPIRDLCNALDCVIQHHGEMSDGIVEPLEAQARAAEELLAAPSAPSVQDILQ